MRKVALEPSSVPNETETPCCRGMSAGTCSWGIGGRARLQVSPPLVSSHIQVTERTTCR